MNNNTLDYDYCGEEHKNTPIIEKPKRFGYKGKIYGLPQINSGRRTVDNVCLNCLNEELELIKNN